MDETMLIATVAGTVATIIGCVFAILTFAKKPPRSNDSMISVPRGGRGGGTNGLPQGGAGADGAIIRLPNGATIILGGAGGGGAGPPRGVGGDGGDAGSVKTDDMVVKGSKGGRGGAA